MSIAVMSAVWAHSSAKGGDLLVLLAIADFAHDNGVAFPSVPTLAKKSRLSDRQVTSILKRLHSHGELEIKKNQGPKGTNLYRVLNRGEALSPGYEALSPGGGEAGNTQMVKSASYEPSGNHQKSHSGQAAVQGPEFPKKVRDALWDALVLATGIDPKSIGERSRFGKSVLEILRAGGTADEIPARARRYSMKYQGAALTDRALANRWGELGSKARARAGIQSVKCPECDLEFAPRVLIEHRYTSHDVGWLCDKCGAVAPDAKSHKCTKTGQNPA